MERPFERRRPQKEGLSVYRSIDRTDSEKIREIRVDSETYYMMMWRSRGLNIFKLIEIPAKTEFKYSIR